MEYPDYRLPEVLRHMVVAVFEKLDGSPRKRFLGAMKVARFRLVQLKYLTPPSLEGPLERIELTATGSKLNKKHASEGRAKNSKFKALYEKYRADLEVEKLKDDPE